jgi:hypothetical protein
VHTLLDQSGASRKNHCRSGSPSLCWSIKKKKQDAHGSRGPAQQCVDFRFLRGGLSVGVLTEFLQLWDTLQGVSLQPDNEDTHTWRLTSNGQYSTKSTYDALFLGGAPSLAHERGFGRHGPLQNATSSCG